MWGQWLLSALPREAVWNWPAWYLIVLAPFPIFWPLLGDTEPAGCWLLASVSGQTGQNSGTPSEHRERIQGPGSHRTQQMHLLGANTLLEQP